MEDGIEKKILEELCVRLVASKSEIMAFLKDNEVTQAIVDSVSKSMVQKGLLTEVYSSSRSFAITRKGMRCSRL